MLKMAITKGRIEQSFCNLLQKSGYDIDPIINKDRKLLIKTNDNLEIVFAKSKDVLKFVNEGITDIGIVGKDTLLESDDNNYEELLDLNTGKCKFCLAAEPSYRARVVNKKKVIATKYPKITKEYFNKKNEDVKIVKLDGSVELGPIIGIADAIVDIVETGNTLKANGLEIIEDVCEISTRLIASKDSITNKKKEINKIVGKLKVKEDI